MRFLKYLMSFVFFASSTSAYGADIASLDREGEGNNPNLTVPMFRGGLSATPSNDGSYGPQTRQLSTLLGGLSPAALPVDSDGAVSPADLSGGTFDRRVSAIEDYLPPSGKRARDVSSILEHIALNAENPQKKVCFLDADETLWVSKVGDDGKDTVVRLYQDLEMLIDQLKKAGYEVYILTYNLRAQVERNSGIIGLDLNSVDGILACNLKGDLWTAKGRLVHEFFAGKNPEEYSAVFVDNFGPFIDNVEAVAREMGLDLTAIEVDGYEEHYHAYLWHFLKRLQEALNDLPESERPVASSDVVLASTKVVQEIPLGTEVNLHDRTAKGTLNRIQKSLTAFGIDIMRFVAQFPESRAFEDWAKEVGVTWPFLNYL